MFSDSFRGTNRSFVRRPTTFSAPAPGSRHDTPIELSDDEDQPIQGSRNRTYRVSDRRHDVMDLTDSSEPPGNRRRLDNNGSVITNPANEDDDELALGLELDEREIRNLRTARTLHGGLPAGHRPINSARTKFDLTVTANKDVQLSRNHRGDLERFLRIKHVTVDREGEIWLVGILMKRNVDVYYHVSNDGTPLHPILPSTRNDVAVVLRGDPDTIHTFIHGEGLTLVHISEVEREREIIFTNKTIDEIDYRTRGLTTVPRPGQDRRELEKFVRDFGLLCCRHKYVESVQGKYGIPARVGPLDHAECDEGMAVPAMVRISGYGPRSTDKKKKKSTWETELVDLTVDSTTHSMTSRHEGPHRDHEGSNPSSLPRPQQRSSNPITRSYTHGEICAGLGGSLRGAEQAGLIPDWAVDKWDVAVNTLRQNWPRLGSRIMEISIQDFVLKIQANPNYVVDVIHISFPCQGHSYMNRGTNPERDMINNETIIALGPVLQYLRPRIVTLEQTNGILTKNEGFWFRKVVCQLTSAGYTVANKVLNMADFGLCQARRRLIVVAACPGQKLPNWPSPTHGEGFRPRGTLGQAISYIPAWATEHNVEHHKQTIHRNLPIAEMNKPLKNLIDTSGAQCLLTDTDGTTYWPSWRQQMRMQGFPDEHRITGNKQTDFATQIGNAVPPLFAKVLFKEVIKALKETDREREEWNRAIVID